jgi:hypothetical protein
MVTGLRNDQRGFVLSGLALLLVLPAMLLAASCLKTIEVGGEATSLQTLSDKVSYTGYDIERMIKYMTNKKIPIDNSTLNSLAENYRAVTGLLVDIVPTPHIVVLAREKLDQGEEYELETTLFGFELDVEAENKGAVIDVEFEFGGVENDGQGTDFTRSIQRDNVLAEVIVGGGWLEVRYTAGTKVRGVFLSVRDPRGAARYLSTMRLE